MDIARESLGWMHLEDEGQAKLRVIVVAGRSHHSLAYVLPYPLFGRISAGRSSLDCPSFSASIIRIRCVPFLGARCSVTLFPALARTKARNSLSAPDP